MKKLYLLSTAAVIMVAGSASAVEPGKSYLKVDAGYGFAPGRYKLEVKEGASSMMRKTKSVVSRGFLAGPGVGYNVSEEFRTDLSFIYGFNPKATIKDDKLNGMIVGFDKEFGKGAKVETRYRLWAAMLNFYYDFNNTSDFTPFINAGLGYGATRLNVKVKDITTARANGDNPFGELKSKKGLAWGVGAGVAYKMTDAIHADLSYRILGLRANWNAKNVALKDNDTIKVKGPAIIQSVNLGVRLSF